MENQILKSSNMWPLKLKVFFIKINPFLSRHAKHLKLITLMKIADGLYNPDWSDESLKKYYAYFQLDKIQRKNTATAKGFYPVWDGDPKKICFKSEEIAKYFASDPLNKKIYNDYINSITQ